MHSGTVECNQDMNARTLRRLKGVLAVLAMLPVPALAGESIPSGAVLVPVSGEGWTREAKEAIRAVGTNALPSLLALVSRRGQSEVISRQVARVGFEALGPDAASAVPELTRLLEDPAPEVRSGAIGCLEAVGAVASNSVPRLIRALDDRDEEVRRSAVAALGHIHGNASIVVPSLISYLDRPRPDNGWGKFEKAAAVTALGQYASESAAALTALRRMTNDPSPVVRLKARMQLNALEHPPR